MQPRKPFNPGRNAIALLVPAVLLLAGCHRAPASGSTGKARPATPLTLSPIDARDRKSAGLAGKGECQFASMVGGQPLLVARSLAATGRAVDAVARIGTLAKTLSMDGGGGYHALTDGGHFSGKNLTVQVKLEKGQPIPRTAPSVPESPIHRAVLTASRGSQTETVSGYWECSS